MLRIADINIYIYIYKCEIHPFRCKVAEICRVDRTLGEAPRSSTTDFKLLKFFHTNLRATAMSDSWGSKINRCFNRAPRMFTDLMEITTTRSAHNLADLFTELR